jgi:hypothetical protein
MLVQDDIPNLINGISQQPAKQRLSSQGEEQINGMSSIVEGLKKRSPTSHLAKLLSGTVSDAFVHMINRDENERYVVVVTNNTLRVFTLEGTEVAVSGDMHYVTTNTPSDDLRAVTIADYTVIVNRKKTVFVEQNGAVFTVRFPTVVAGDSFFMQINNAESLTYVAVGGDNPTSIAQQFATTWYNPALYTVTRNGDELTIQGISTQLNQEFHLEATRTLVSDGSQEEGSITSTPAKDLTALVYVKQGNYSLNYIVKVYEASSTPAYQFTHTTSDTVINTIRTDSIATALKTGLDALTNFTSHYTVTVNGSLMKFERNDGALTPFSVSVQDSNGDRNMVAIQGRVQKFVDVPTKCFDGQTVKIEGDTASEADDYYVQFSINDNDSGAIFGAGTWSESRQKGIAHDFELHSMPHTLVRQADGTFVFGHGEWASRQVGDLTSNPPPSFVGGVIEDVFFHRNRLGFLSDDNWILSEAGEYFNFWRTTVQAILDGDPIDVSAANEKVTLLKYAVSAGEKLLLVSDQQQFIGSGGELLTAKTAAIKPTTAHETTGICRPSSLGSSVFFTVERGDFSGLREYRPGKDSRADEAPDVTSHVPSYIPAEVFKMTAASNENVLVLLNKTTGSEDEIHVYKFFYIGEDKLQASWSKWQMSSGCKVLDAGFIHSTLYLVLQREDGVYLESMGVAADRKETGMDFEILLDRRVTEAVAIPTYSAATNTTTWTLPYSTAETPQVIVTNSPPNPYREGQVLNTTKASNTTLTILGDLRTVPVVIGVPYEFSYELSEICMRTAGGQGGEKSMIGGRLQIRNVTLLYEGTGYFRVEVTPTHGDTFTYVCTPKQLGQTLIGGAVLASGEFTFPVMAKSDEVTIRIVNDSYLPSRFLSASWEGEYVLSALRQR